jgi:hypothetical protein
LLRRVSLAFALFFIFVCLALAVAVVASMLSDDRSTYQASSTDALAQFAHEQQEARGRGAAWVGDAGEVAARFTCREECGPRLVSSAATDPGRTVYLIEYPNIEDDSIQAMKYRVDLVQNGGAWEVEWAGWKQRCRRVGWLETILGGYWGWHTKLCP